LFPVVLFEPGETTIEFKGEKSMIQIVIIQNGPFVHGVLSDCEKIKILLADYGTEGCCPGWIKEDPDGVEVFIDEIVPEVEPERVAKFFELHGYPLKKFQWDCEECGAENHTVINEEIEPKCSRCGWEYSWEVIYASKGVRKTDKTHLRLTVDVTYYRNGVPKAELEENLLLFVDWAMDQGLFLGKTSAEVDTVSFDVEEIE
jgi:hypothetical protein